jgi:hypothetical protein
MKYLDKLKVYKGDVYTSSKGNKFNTFIEAVQDSSPDEDGMIYICIENESASNIEPKTIDHLIDCLGRNEFAKERYVYVSPEKDEIYAEHFLLGRSDYFFDYGFLFGDVKHYPEHSVLKSTLYPGKDIIIVFNIGLLSGENKESYQSKEAILNKEQKYQQCDINLYYQMATCFGPNGEIWNWEFCPGSTLYE